MQRKKRLLMPLIKTIEYITAEIERVKEVYPDTEKYDIIPMQPFYVQLEHVKKLLTLATFGNSIVILDEYDTENALC